MTDVTDVADGVDWQPRARELASTLTESGVITDPAWRAAFEATPRHVFVPRFWALDEYNAPARLVDGADPNQRTEWLDTVYSDQFLTTQYAPPDDTGRRTVTSSASLPALVARMLRLLDVRDGQRVLEIGTGTGYNTALLCHRLGDTTVASVDIDSTLIEAATERLAQIGQHPLLVTVDGGYGLEDAAPYDRVLSTCASPGVPVAWIEQLAEDGVIVAPFTVGGALAVLTRTGPEEVSGRLDSEQAWFMPLRPADEPLPDGHLVDLPALASRYTSTTDIELAAFADPDFRLWLSLHLPPGTRMVDLVDDQFTRTGVVVHTASHRADGQFATSGSSTPARVTQDEGRLFDTVETAWHAWLRYGRPRRDRIGITARTDGTQLAWLDSPRSEITWPLPTS